VVSLLVVGSGILGATALEDFALALAAGLFIGSYSSIFVAAPLLALWKEREPQYRAVAERRRRTSSAPAPVAATAPASVGGAGVPVGTDEPAEPGVRPRASQVGVPGPPAVPRQTIQARPRQQRGKKRK
jgi:preprotein translocase subunit SecF